MRRYFLGLSANYNWKDVLVHLFTVGRQRDCEQLRKLLSSKYGGEAILTKNGRSALALVLKIYFNKGESVIINGFTCYAVYEAVMAAGLNPVFADIEKEGLNFSVNTLKEAYERSCQSGKRPVGVIIQNTLGNTVDAKAIEEFAKKYKLAIVEDLAHCAGRKYPDGREVGSLGVATILSFGKDKAIDTVSGGAAILRHPCKSPKQAPTNLPKNSSQNPPKLADHLRARFYPLFGLIARGLSYVYLGGIWMKLLVKLRWVERSADSRLDMEQKISKFEARLALRQIRKLGSKSKKPLREYRLVEKRDELLKKLKGLGCYFEGFWYEKPISPVRYYKKTHFPESQCPIAVEVSAKIINLPTYYKKGALARAKKLIEIYEEKQK